MSPLQYHKRLRLYEAQRLMLAGEMDAGSAGLAVGYESTAQFNREYKRLFGEPPLRDLKRMRRHDACPSENSHRAPKNVLQGSEKLRKKNSCL